MSKRNSALPPSESPSAGRLSADDVFLYREGRHFRLWEKMGGRIAKRDGVAGASFAVWAPAAERVSVIGSFNRWEKDAHPLAPLEESGLWEGFVPGARRGEAYKLHVVSKLNQAAGDKADPFALASELAPRQGSRLWDLDFAWSDETWLSERSERQAFDRPLSIYELHLGSWKRDAAGNHLTYREIAEPLADYLLAHGFTHAQFLPVMEHPYYGSWGYQITGFFAPTARYGSPQDLMALVDHLHGRGLGVIFDWVPSHFPTDGHGLAFFDGTHLYEHADPRRGFQPDWKSLIFNYDRGEVISFLVSSALFWLEEYHADGLRVDAVASMLYRDYSRGDGEWVPNRHGGKENLEAVEFLRRLNDAVHENVPGALMIAEESTSWPGVTRDTQLGGLGFDLKWDMGWMNDSLKYFELDPLARKYEHQLLTFRPMYHNSERFLLALSHDEVVHGKRSLLDKMPGTVSQKFANLRALLGLMWAEPGKKLLFMGCELGQWREWSHERQLDWDLASEPRHSGLARWVADLNRTLAAQATLHAGDYTGVGFEWVDCHDTDQSVVSFLRKAPDCPEVLLAVFNLTPVARWPYRLGVPFSGLWEELLSSDAEQYGGEGGGNLGGLDAEEIEQHGRPFSLEVYLPPLSALFFLHPGPPTEEEETAVELSEATSS